MNTLQIKANFYYETMKWKIKLALTKWSEKYKDFCYHIKYESKLAKYLWSKQWFVKTNRFLHGRLFFYKSKNKSFTWGLSYYLNLSNWFYNKFKYKGIYSITILGFEYTKYK